MEIKVCTECKRMFNSYSEMVVLCPVCTRKHEEKYEEVKTYMQEHPGVGIAVLSKECDVPIKTIYEWIDDERLIFTQGESDGIYCEKCGERISAGKYCEKCRKEMINNLESLGNELGKDNMGKNNVYTKKGVYMRHREINDK